jgi:hypothetical protein
MEVLMQVGFMLLNSKSPVRWREHPALAPKSLAPLGAEMLLLLKI